MRALLLALAVVSSAAAQSDSSTAGPRPSTAAATSVGSTLGAVALGAAVASLGGQDDAGAVIVLGGVFLAPAAGNLLVGNERGAAVGTAVRLAGGALVVAGLTDGFTGDVFSGSGPLATAAVLSGLGAIVGGAVYDAASAGAYAHRVRVRPGGRGVALTVAL